MKTSVASTIITIITLVIGLLILPTYFRSIEVARDDAVRAQNAARNFLDMVIDNQTISEASIEDLNLALAECTTYYEYTFYREMKTVTPGLNGTYEVAWTAVDTTVGDRLLQGDFITIEIKQTSMSVWQRISSILSSSSSSMYDVRFSAMVR